MDAVVVVQDAAARGEGAPCLPWMLGTAGVVSGEFLFRGDAPRRWRAWRSRRRAARQFHLAAPRETASGGKRNKRAGPEPQEEKAILCLQALAASPSQLLSSLSRQSAALPALHCTELSLCISSFRHQQHHRQPCSRRHAFAEQQPHISASADGRCLCGICGQRSAALLSPPFRPSLCGRQRSLSRGRAEGS